MSKVRIIFAVEVKWEWGGKEVHVVFATKNNKEVRILLEKREEVFSQIVVGFI
jgi:hypothetical protein